MIRVVVGGQDGSSGAEWILHENLLLANSGFAKAAMTNDCEEKVTGNIKMPDADPEAFGVFADYIYKERLDAAKLNIDQLLAVYFLADYVDCAKLADTVFEKIYNRTHNSAFVYTAKQIVYILSHTIDVQPLRTLMLDQVGRGVLDRQYNFAAAEEEDLFQPHMRELMAAVVKTINEGGVSLSTVPYPPIGNYLKHDISHLAKEAEGPAAPVREPPVDATTLFEAEVGREGITFLIAQTGASRAKAIRALKNSGSSVSAAIRWLRTN